MRKHTLTLTQHEIDLIVSALNYACLTDGMNSERGKLAAAILLYGKNPKPTKRKSGGGL